MLPTIDLFLILRLYKFLYSLSFMLKEVFSLSLLSIYDFDFGNLIFNMNSF